MLQTKLELASGETAS